MLSPRITSFDYLGSRAKFQFLPYCVFFIFTLPVPYRDITHLIFTSELCYIGLLVALPIVIIHWLHGTCLYVTLHSLVLKLPLHVWYRSKTISLSRRYQQYVAFFLHLLLSLPLSYSKRSEDEWPSAGESIKRLSVNAEKRLVLDRYIDTSDVRYCFEILPQIKKFGYFWQNLAILANFDKFW